MKAEHYIPFLLQVLTPVHIGSGDIFTPLSYLVRNPSPGQYELWLVDGQAWLASHADEKPVSEALDKGDMEGLRSLINRAADIKYFVQSRIAISSPLLGKELFDRRAHIDSRAEIQAFTRNPFTRQAYVPASSLKGAISTALAFYANAARVQKKLPPLCDPSGKLDKKVLDEIYGRISDHAMRALRLADMAVPPGRTSIRKAIGKDLAPAKSMDKTPCETLNPEKGGQGTMTGLMRIFSSGDSKCPGLSGSQAFIRLRNPGENIDADRLWKICRDFYRSRFIAEFDKFYCLPDFLDTGRALEKVRQRVENLAEDETLLRVGRYSHIECVTVSGVSRGRSAGGQSRTLADALLPFGWIILKRCAMEEYYRAQNELAAALAQEAENAEDILRERVHIQAEASQRAAAAAQTRRKLDEEAERKAREEEEARRKREEILASFATWQERAIFELGEEGADDGKAQEIYRKLDDCGEYTIRVAEALKALWLRLNKWEGRTLTPKQKVKVEKVSAILGIQVQESAPAQPTSKGKKKKRK